MFGRRRQYIIRYSPDEGGGGGGGKPNVVTVTDPTLSAEVRDLKAKLAAMEADKAAAVEAERKKAEEAAAKALKDAQEKAEKAEKDLADERAAVAQDKLHRALWASLTDGKLTDQDGDEGKPLRVRTDVFDIDRFTKLHDVSGIKLGADGKLPADFVSTVRGWAREFPGGFQVGEAPSADGSDEFVTGGGSLPKPAAGSTAAAEAEAQARAALEGMGVLQPKQQ